MLVAESAASAFGDLHAIARVRQIREKTLALAFGRAVDKRADRNVDRKILAALAGLVRSAARFAGVGMERAFETKLDERRKLRGSFEEDAPAVPAVPVACAGELGPALPVVLI